MNTYNFYNNEVLLKFDQRKHVYSRLIGREWIPQKNVSTIVKIIDKSTFLIPWAAKKTVEKAALLAEDYKDFNWPTGEEFYLFSPRELNALLLSAKSAHKDILEDAGNVGKIAHQHIEGAIICAIHNTDGIVDYDYPYQEYLDDRALNCIIAALAWMKFHNVRWKSTEKKIYSRQYGYAGTMDGLALVDSCRDKKCCSSKFADRLSIIDWKSSNALHQEYILQVSAYRQAYCEEFQNEAVTGGFILRLGKEDGKFEPWALDETLFTFGMEAFNSCLLLGSAMDILNEHMKFVKKSKKPVKVKKGKK
jgi:hypothetical protein